MDRRHVCDSQALSASAQQGSSKPSRWPAAATLTGVTAAILAGGLGTRLRPAVADRPKVLATVHNRPYLTYLLDQLAAASVDEVVLLTGYRSDQVYHTLGEAYGRVRLHYSPEPSPLGTAGAVRNALPKLASGMLLLMNGDSFCEVDLAAFGTFNRRHAADVSLVVTRVADSSRYDRVRINGAGRVTGLEQKRPEGGPAWINAGVYLIGRRMIQEIPCGRPVSLEREMLPAWIDQRRVYGLRCPGRFLDIGTPDSYAQATSFFRP
ncbi:MAG TPA: nucleotidyltransferase family protein [Gemmataceae bacterium]|jgi:NDP-sugar pyrophosphorylase family protein|nr:nucleotidyltransferase family protein [Gemmataceae bacterium]